jgi:acyl-CoA synthetase (AMP-forming)/AMP-acid ligase II/acyl carrier protein
MDQVELRPEAPVIFAPGRDSLTYRLLARQMRHIVFRLSDMGVGRSDRVAVVLPNGPEMATAFLGIACSAVCAPLNPYYQAAEYEFFLSDLAARVLITSAGLAPAALEAAQGLGIPVLEITPEAQGPAGLFNLSCVERYYGIAPDRTSPDDIALVLHTSGTTARPKIVPLTHKNLCASALNVGSTLHLSPLDRCLNVMPLFHIHGLVASLLSSLTAGASVVCTPGFFAPNFFEWLEEMKPTWYTAVPTMHQAILQRGDKNRDIIRSNPLRFIRSSSSSLPPKVMEDLERLFDTPVIEAYGMTEAAHQMASNPLPPLTRKPGSVGLAAGPEMAVMDEERNEQLIAGETGEIVIRGPNVMAGYAGRPEVNAVAFAGDWLRTGDQGYMDEDGYFFITGRIKELINRGGEKISPREVDEVLLEHPKVAQVVTFAMLDRSLGEEVAAAVITTDPEVTEQELRRFAAGRLAHFKVPRRIVIVHDIPKGPTGKLQRIGLAERLGLIDTEIMGESIEFVSPRNHIEETLSLLWIEVLRIPVVGIHHRFMDLGGDSILATLLAARITRRFQIEFPLVVFMDIPTVAGQAEFVERILMDQIEKMSDQDVLDALEKKTEKWE